MLPGVPDRAVDGSERIVRKCSSRGDFPLLERNLRTARDDLRGSLGLFRKISGKVAGHHGHLVNPQGSTDIHHLADDVLPAVERIARGQEAAGIVALQAIRFDHILSLAVRQIYLRRQAVLRPRRMHEAKSCNCGQHGRCLSHGIPQLPHSVVDCSYAGHVGPPKLNAHDVSRLWCGRPSGYHEHAGSQLPVRDSRYFTVSYRWAEDADSLTT
jgi:hypothetical protein